MAALERVKRDGNAAAKAKAEEALVVVCTSGESAMAESPFARRLLDSANPETQSKAAEEISTAVDKDTAGCEAFRTCCFSDGTLLVLNKALGDTTNDRVRLYVCWAIVRLAIGAEGKAACVKAGSEKVVTAVLETTKDERVREKACMAIYNIALSAEGKAACVRAGAPAAIVSVLKATNDDEVMRYGSLALRNIASESRPAV